MPRTCRSIISSTRPSLSGCMPEVPSPRPAGSRIRPVFGGGGQSGRLPWGCRRMSHCGINRVGGITPGMPSSMWVGVKVMVTR